MSFKEFSNDHRMAGGGVMGGRLWTPHEEEVLVKLFKHGTLKELEFALPGRAAESIDRKAYNLGLRRRRTNYRVDPVFERLREIREEKEIARIDFSETTGHSVISFCRWETGQAFPSWLKFRDWLDGLECDLLVVPKTKEKAEVDILKEIDSRRKREISVSSIQPQLNSGSGISRPRLIPYRHRGAG